MTETWNALPPVSVVVPVLDEQDNVEPLYREIRSALGPVTEHEIIFVDDGSRDATPDRLRRLAEEPESRLRVVRHPRPFGQSAAVRSGVLAARHAWIATLDGDRQNDPQDLVDMLQRAAARGPGAPQVLFIGHRVNRRDSGMKRFASRFANGLRSRLLRDGTPDTGCGIKLFPRDLFLRLPYFDHMHRFLPALVQREGGEAVSVPVHHRAREEGRSKYGIIDRALAGAWDLLGVAWLISRSPRDYNAREVKPGE
ncbi:MAG: glycosyltransferase [Gammaproteobacteria bacterium]